MYQARLKPKVAPFWPAGRMFDTPALTQITVGTRCAPVSCLQKRCHDFKSRQTTTWTHKLLRAGNTFHRSSTAAYATPTLKQGKAPAWNLTALCHRGQQQHQSRMLRNKGRNYQVDQHRGGALKKIFNINEKIQGTSLDFITGKLTLGGGNLDMTLAFNTVWNRYL